MTKYCSVEGEGGGEYTYMIQVLSALSALLQPYLSSININLLSLFDIKKI